MVNSKLISFFVLLTVSFAVHAQVPVENPNGFQRRFSEWDVTTELKRRLDLATTRIVFTSKVANSALFGSSTESSGQCSGAFISQNGYLLTARHCIVQSLRGKLFLSLDEASPTDYAAGLGILKKGMYPIRLTTKSYADVSEQTATARLIAIGPPGGMKRVLNELGMVPDLVDRSLDFLERGFGLDGDWAIMKIDGYRPKTCLSVSREPAKQGQAVYSLGYPGNFPDRGYQTDGSIFFVAKGLVDATENERWVEQHIQNSREPEPTRDQFGTAQDFELAHHIWELNPKFTKRLLADNVLPVSSYLAPGFSGGPALNESAQVIGLNIGVNKDRGTSFVNTISNVLRGLAAARGIDPTIPSDEELFACAR